MRGVGGVRWNVMWAQRAVGCDVDAGAGAASERVLWPDIQALAPK